MKRKNTTRNALFTSIISLLLCVSMLVGATFAWFTDSVVSGNNVIAAGNLDIELYNDGNKVTESTNLFDGITWEPGVVDYENFTIKNEGNLALLYNFAMTWGDYNTLAGQYNLTQVLKVAMVDKHVTGDRAAAIAAGEAAGWKALDSWSFSGEMTTQGEEKNFALIIYWEPSDNDNNYNVQNGKTTSDGQALYVNLGINLQATQKMYESDSFGPDYDSLANAWDGTAGKLPAEENGVITLTTGAELAAFAAAVNNGTNSFSGKTVVLGADINLGNQPWTPIGDCESGKYFQGTFDGQGHTIYNLSVDYSNDPSQHATAGLFGWVDFAMATVKNVKLENATVLGSHWVGGIAGYFTGRIENCSVNNSTIMGFNVNDDANGDKVGGIVGCLNEHSYINNNSVSNTKITGNRDIGGIAGTVAAYTYEMKNNTVKDTTLCYSAEKDYVSAGKIVSGRTGYVADNTNVDTNVTIVRVINVKTVAELNSALAALSDDAWNTAAILQNCNEPNGVVEIPAAYTGTLTLKDSSIASVQAEKAANLVIAGTVKVENADGSAITGVELNISGNGNLTAIANDSRNDKTHYYGIGGNQTESINIENVHIVKVAGGLVNPKVTSSWGKSDVEGGAAIGSGYTGAVITLNNVTVDEALGGSKAAGIGGRYHTGVTVNINNSVIKNVVGGANSAAIGGSRMTQSTTTGAENNITVNIKNSKINATGGDFGAAIGSGYNTYTNGITITPVISVTIDDASEITAQGGWLGAGIGTGHNAIGFVGKIACDTSNVKAGSSVEPVKEVDGIDCCYGAATTVAQDVGYGVLKVEAFPEIAGKLVTSVTELAQAVADGATNLYLADGEYSIDNCAGKTLTISGGKGAVIKVSDEGENGHDYGFDGSTVTFNGVTIDTTTNGGPYKGFARMNGTYNDCAFVGSYTTSSGVHKFYNCEFDLRNNYVWTWGASEVLFDNCTFEDANGVGKAILVHEGADVTNVTVCDCTFIASTAAYTWDGLYVAAVSIDPNGASKQITVNFEGANTVVTAAGAPADNNGNTGFAGLHQIKYANESGQIKVTINGKVVDNIVATDYNPDL